jgi:hypothetical protein
MSQQLEKFFDRQFGLLKDAAQYRPWDVETIVTRHGNMEMRFRRMPKLRMASGLVVDIKPGPQERAKNLSRLENRKLCAHQALKATRSRAV